MLYVEGRKSFEVRSEKKIMTLPCAKNNTRQTIEFAVCKKNAHGKIGKIWILPYAFFLPCVFVVAHDKISLCRVPDKKHTAKT